MVLVMGVGMAFGQKAVEFRINPEFGFSDPEGKKDIIVNFPGKTAHQIYTMMAVNIGQMYYNPAEVMYGVEDQFISVCGYSSDFCQAGGFQFSAKYSIRFLIKDGKVLVVNPDIYSISSGNYASSRREFTFPDLIKKYWYANGQFISSESNNMSACEANMSRVVNKILGIEPVYRAPVNW